jgi:hypothetical protein
MSRGYPMFYRSNFKIEFVELEDVIPMEYKRINEDGLFIMPCMIDHDSLDLLIACVGDLTSYPRFDHQLNLLFYQLRLKPLRQTPTITAIDANHFIDYLKETTQFYTDIRHIIDVSSLFVLRGFPYDVSEYEKTKIVPIDDDVNRFDQPRLIIGGNNEKLLTYIKAFNMKKARYQDGYYSIFINVRSSTNDSDILFDTKFINMVVSGCLVIHVLQSSETGSATTKWIREVIIPQILHISRLAYVIVVLDERFGHSTMYDDLRNHSIYVK